MIVEDGNVGRASKGILKALTFTLWTEGSGNTHNFFPDY